MAEFPGQSIGGVNQGGIQPCYYVDAAGNQFWGVQTKLGLQYQYVVYKQSYDGTIVIAWSHVGGQGKRRELRRAKPAALPVLRAASGAR